MAGVFARGVSEKNWDPLRIIATVEASKYGTQIGFGTSLPKNDAKDQNWRGSRLGEHPKKIWDPYVFLQPLKLASSNLVSNLVLGLAYQKQRFGPKLAGSGPAEPTKKIWDPLLISATVEASNFKFGTELRFGTSLP